MGNDGEKTKQKNPHKGDKDVDIHLYVLEGLSFDTSNVTLQSIQ